jgi:hypothetical protein
MRYIIVKKDDKGVWVKKGTDIFDSFYDALAKTGRGERIVICKETGLA